MTGNQIAYKNAVETERWHKATEAENVRHNKETETIQRRANELQESAIETNRKLAAETARHNVINEQLTSSYNAAMISKSYADSAVSYANAGLLQARTTTETLYNQPLLATQAALNDVNVGYTMAKTQNVQMDTGLKRAQTKTESFKPFLNGVQTGANVLTAIGQTILNALRVAK